MNRIDRQRHVLDCLADELQGPVHALALKLQSPQEAEKLSQFGNPYLHNAIALAPHNAKAQAVKLKNLADIGDDPRLVNDQTGHRTGFIIGQVPAHFAIEVAQR